MFTAGLDLKDVWSLHTDLQLLFLILPLLPVECTLSSAWCKQCCKCSCVVQENQVVAERLQSFAHLLEANDCCSTQQVGWSVVSFLFLFLLTFFPSGVLVEVWISSLHATFGFAQQMRRLPSSKQSSPSLQVASINFSLSVTMTRMFPQTSARCSDLSASLVQVSHENLHSLQVCMTCGVFCCCCCCCLKHSSFHHQMLLLHNEQRKLVSWTECLRTRKPCFKRRAVILFFFLTSPLIRRAPMLRALLHRVLWWCKAQRGCWTLRNHTLSQKASNTWPSGMQPFYRAKTWVCWLMHQPRRANIFFFLKKSGGSEFSLSETTSNLSQQVVKKGMCFFFKKKKKKNTWLSK